MANRLLVDEAASARLFELGDGIVQMGDDNFRRLCGLTPSVPRDEVELELSLVNLKIPEGRESGPRSAGPPFGPGSPRHRR